MKRKQPPGHSLYAVIDKDTCGQRPIAKIISQCLDSGIKIIQYRDKTEDINGFYKNALLLKNIIAGKALYIINDRADIARLVHADGLHIGQYDLPVCAAREIIGRNKIIGKSCHSLKQAISAEKEGADYISIGPIFKTPTKPGYNPVGLKLLSEVKNRLKIPIAAIGGINKSNISLIREFNTSYIALVREICLAENIKDAITKLHP